MEKPYQMKVVIEFIKFMTFFNTLVDHSPVALLANKLFESSKLLTNLASFFANLFCKNAPASVEKILFGVGVTAITVKVCRSLLTQYKMWGWVPEHFINRKKVNSQNLKSTYGDCYAVVTGCTDGIGYAFAVEMARFGFGLVLVARNEQKLNRRIEELKAIQPQLRYEKVIGDLSVEKDIDSVVEQLAELSTHIDIGIVVNNAGMGEFKGPYSTIPVRMISDTFRTNWLATYKITAELLPRLRKRSNRSALINFSSIMGVYISHYNGVYSATKQILDIYTRTLAIQNKDNVDVISVRPLGVKTSMMAMKSGPFMITPKDCVISTLADLGKHDTTWTGFMHKVQISFLERLNQKQKFQVFDLLIRKIDK